MCRLWTPIYTTRNAKEMSYKDMTWCTEESCANKNKCPRYFTKEDAAKAKEWWGSEGAPIAVFLESKQLDCYEPENQDKS